MPELTRASDGQGTGFWCSCPAFKYSNLNPQSICKAMLASVDVTARVTKREGGSTHFVAWTTPGEEYDVVHEPTGTPGFCKHCARCASFLAGDWLQKGLTQMRAEKEGAKQEVKILEKEIKNLRRKAQWTKPNKK